MNEVFVVKPEQLVPGMVLAEDLRHDKTGLVLIPRETLLNEGHLEQLSHFTTNKDCVIYDPSQIMKAAICESKEATTPSCELKPLPFYITSTTQRIYVETFDTVKQLFKKDNIEENDVEEMKQAATDISEEIMRDPQILLQIAVLKAIDNYTFSHSVHVAIYATALASFLNFPPDKLKDISLAALLHDIGKLDIPRGILEKPGRLTDEEFLIMKKHSRLGYERLKNMNNLNKDIIAAISQHHEKVDGTGYYQGLKGEEIHPWGKILATADVYDAVTTNRVYRRALLPHEGAEIVMGSSVDHLDYKLVQTFTSNISFYPMGTRVILNTGETGHVIDLHPNAPLRPVIKVESRDKRIIDMSKELIIFITSIITE